MDSVLIFANPISGQGKGELIARQLGEGLRIRQWDVRLIFEPAYQLPSHFINTSSPPRAVIVIGGDGTLRTVASRLVKDFAPAPPPPLLPVPLGTANLMSRHLKFAWQENQLVETIHNAIQRHKLLNFDAARANGELFLLMAGVGIDAQIVHDLHKNRQGPIRYTSYVSPALRALRDYDYPSLRVTMDGKEVWPCSPAIAFVGNVPEYGTGFPILPHARPDDGLLDLCILPCRSRNDLLKIILNVATGDHLEAEGVFYAKGKQIRIESPHDVAVQVDGESAGHTPLYIDLLPQRIPFIVP